MNINRIFDVAIAYGKIVNYAHRRAQKLEQIHSVRSRQCGHCQYWMTSYCVPEKKHKQFKSCASAACKLFNTSWHVRYLLHKLTTELMMIDRDILRHMWE